ncbi:SMI1/KNR4 family protein [Deinococcus sp. MIMF12]|uniref:SMI1/KNR4 family protein n=1 Tax=Deinococcus rhizophilus TaxID=3049544 RepID=A0ABT7JDP2_9DEIO|nr:SMI1/KNR4 family protein [Deinococcus rhizophilus]MDL2343170.1 SMI1/KNR4 family protein [Deinococcus rhizophilus]
MDSDLLSTLAQLEAWLAAHAPAIHAGLTPGATDTDLDALEAHIGRQLPQAYRTLYRTHADWGHALGLSFLPLGRVQGEWERWRGLDESQETAGHTSHPPGAIKTQYTNPGWIAFLKDWGGNSVGVDLDPGPSGEAGQVITFGRDENGKYVLADSLDAFLREYVTRLEAGRVHLHQHEPGEPGTLRLYLLDVDGQGSEFYRQLSDLYPGFGAAPARRSC